MTNVLSVLPIEHVSLVDLAVKGMQSAIEAGRLEPGSRLPGELDWAKRLGVSRTVVREALGRLKALGVVQISRGRNRGASVSDTDTLCRGAEILRSVLTVSAKDLLPFLDFRAGLEIHAAGRAAELVKPAQVQELKALCGAMDAPSTSDDEAVGIDFRFHRRILEIAGNPISLSMFDVSQSLIEGGIRAMNPDGRKREVSRTHHRHIVTGIANRDSVAARSAMQRHMDYVLRYFRSVAVVTPDA